MQIMIVVSHYVPPLFYNMIIIITAHTHTCFHGRLKYEILHNHV